MNDREKLIELLYDQFEHLYEPLDDAYIYRRMGMSANILIMHGVTIQKQGEWILVDKKKGTGVCSNCHRLEHIDPIATHCRYCGAKMKEVK